jgi:hypothetical protein
MPSSLAMRQLQKIEQQVNRYQQLNTADSHVQVIRFTEILHLNKRVLTVQCTAKTRTICRSA